MKTVPSVFLLLLACLGLALGGLALGVEQAVAPAAPSASPTALPVVLPTATPTTPPPTATPTALPPTMPPPPTVPPPPMPADDGCSENPYYAKAIVALAWLETHPPANPYPAQQYSHAVLESLYDQLYAEGQVGPVPPPCQVTARAPLTVYTTPDAASAPVWTLAAGEALDVYGRNDGATWFQVVTPGGWGWVSADAVDLQPGAEVDRMPILG